jgi:hypothetical protein
MVRHGHTQDVLVEGPCEVGVQGLLVQNGLACDAQAGIDVCLRGWEGGGGRLQYGRLRERGAWWHREQITWACCGGTGMAHGLLHAPMTRPTNLKYCKCSVTMLDKGLGWKAGESTDGVNSA